jgi:hypothetical protein
MPPLELRKFKPVLNGKPISTYVKLHKGPNLKINDDLVIATKD